MAYYNIELKKSAEKDIRKIDKAYIGKIVKKFESLRVNPFTIGVKKLIGTEALYRLRVGDYRIIYSVYVKEKIVVVEYIRHRKDAYK